MIPKVIHYCWFGRTKYPPIVEKCINSWRKYCPNYEIKLWNEENYNVYHCPFLKEAYDSKNWACVSDYARLEIVYREGGIYLDTDVELLKSLDNLIQNECFLASDGEAGINTGLGLGAVKNHPVIKQMLDEYSDRHFMMNGVPDFTPCTVANTRPFLAYGFDPSCSDIQEIMGAVIFPAIYFNPINGNLSELHCTDKTYAIHWRSNLWGKPMDRIKAKLRIRLGIVRTNKIKNILKKRGIWI